MSETPGVTRREAWATEAVDRVRRVAVGRDLSTLGPEGYGPVWGEMVGWTFGLTRDVARLMDVAPARSIDETRRRILDHLRAEQPAKAPVVLDEGPGPDAVRFSSHRCAPPVEPYPGEHPSVWVCRQCGRDWDLVVNAHYEPSDGQDP